MTRRTIAAFALVFLVPAARAQDTPAADIAVGYSLIKVTSGSSLTANGGSGSVALNVNKWLGVVGDFGLYHSGPVASGLAAGTYAFGPRFSYRRWSRVTPFAQVLVGGLRYANNAFAFAAGGGADIGLDGGGRVALRPQVEYFGVRAKGGTTHTVRVGVGVVFRIRKR